MKKTVLTTWLFAAALSSCSVKEDRSPCPCLLTIDLSACPEYRESMPLRGRKGQADCLSEDIDIFENSDRRLTRTIGKGVLSYGICSPLVESSIMDGIIRIPEGSQADPLFAYAQTVDATAETAYDMVQMHKQFAEMTVTFGRLDNTEIESITVMTGSNGLDLISLEPVEGAFRYTSRGENGFFKVRLPRLGDGRILIEARDSEGRVKNYDIGNPVKAAGFDWTAEDLDDFWINYDFSSSSFSVEVSPWDPGFDIPETI